MWKGRELLMSELKPCPFCGAEAVVKEVFWKVHGSAFQKRFVVGCWSVSCRGFVHDSKRLYLSRGVAVRNWNRRAR